MFADLPHPVALKPFLQPALPPQRSSKGIYTSTVMVLDSFPL